jgi:hypothetical protein
VLLVNKLICALEFTFVSLAKITLIADMKLSRRRPVEEE